MPDTAAIPMALRFAQAIIRAAQDRVLPDRLVAHAQDGWHYHAWRIDGSRWAMSAERDGQRGVINWPPIDVETLAHEAPAPKRAV